jgi:hypothetical protein
VAGDAGRLRQIAGMARLRELAADWQDGGAASGQPVTGKVVGTGEGLGAGLGGVGDGLGDVGDGLFGLGDVGDGLVGLGDVGDGLVGLGDVGDGLVGLGDVGDGLGDVGDGLGDGGAQLGTVMVSSSRVTAPLRASIRPTMVTPVVTEIDVKARTLPWKEEPVPSVAELPTCQNTLQAEAPLVRTTELAESVTSVEPIWKMKTAFGSPCAFRVSAPPTSSPDEALYTPGVSVWPAPMNEPTLLAGLRPAASLYAVVKSDWAPAATPSVTCMVPVTMPGGNPVTALPGLRPRSPLMTVGPVLVTVVAARTPKLPAVPRPTGGFAAPAGDCVAMIMAMAALITRNVASHEQPVALCEARPLISVIDRAFLQ